MVQDLNANTQKCHCKHSELLQGLPLQKLHTVFQAIVLSCLMYALPAWGPLLNVELVHKIQMAF